MRKQFANPVPVARRESAAEPAIRAADPVRMQRPELVESVYGNRAFRAMLLTDGVPSEPGQMTKAAFLDALQPAVAAASEEGVSAAGRTSQACPWIAHWFEHYRGKSAEHLERAIRKFAGETADVEEAAGYIPAIVSRVRRGVDRWARTGDIAGLPEGAPVVDPRDPESIRMNLGLGEPIDGATLDRMETALGVNLSEVRLHTGSRAAELASRFNASAFAVGGDIAFASGMFQPGTPQGDALLAHELAHVLQHDEAASPGTSESLEQDANRTAFAGIARLWNRASGGVRNAARGAAPQLRTGLSLQACGSNDAFRTRPSSGNYVQFLSGHAMQRHSTDRRADPLWVPGATDHAAAYTKGASPNVAARAGVPATLSAPGAAPLTVRVVESGSVRGTRTGIAPSSGSVELTGMTLTGLSGSDAMRASDYTLAWEGSLDGANWVSLMTSGPHRIYWLFDSPKTSPLYSKAAAKATQYAAGQSDAQSVAGAIRSGLRRIDTLTYSPSDPIDSDPLDIYTNGIGICTDYANTLTLLALSAGLNANAVMFFGGFQSLGKSVWATLGSSFLTLLNVRSPDPGFNPNPAGWSFTYHAISRIEGVLHDAALDRVGIDANAVHGGKIIHLVELASVPLPPATRAAGYAHPIQRKDHVVQVSIRDYGPRIALADFADIYSLHLPPAAASPITVPVLWSIEGGSLPPGMTLNPANGLVSGTPSTAGSYAPQIKVAAPGLENTTTVNMNVSP